MPQEANTETNTVEQRQESPKGKGAPRALETKLSSDSSTAAAPLPEKDSLSAVSFRKCSKEFVLPSCSTAIRVPKCPSGDHDLAFSASSSISTSSSTSTTSTDSTALFLPTLSISPVPEMPVPEEGVSPTCWFTFLDVMINPELFKKGVVAIAPDSEDFPKEELADASKFDLNSRSLHFGRAVDPKSLRAVEELFIGLQTFGSAAAAPIHLKESAIISNPKRREEIFLPLLVPTGDAQQPSAGSYIYPWLSKPMAKGAKDFQFTGFEQFVTASCMFGTNLRWINQIDRFYPLVKHNVQFFPEEKIVRTEFNEREANPYEEMVFAEFIKQVFLIDRLSTPGKEKRLLYHLPYGDYMLFGVELFIRGRMTLKALNQLFTIILKKKEVYADRIAKICAAHEIALKIESPFDNLFGPLNFDKCPKGKIAQAVLERLGFSCAEIPPEMESKRQQALEFQFVGNCLQRLRQNTFKPEHQRVWQDFMHAAEKLPQTIEDLLKAANASMIAIAAFGKPDFATCSLLPLSEKQIQLEYPRYSKQAGNYPGVFNITTLDPVISYSEDASHGLLFYFADFNRKQTTAELITKFGLLKAASANVAHFAQSEPFVSIQQVLPSPQ